MKRSAWRYLWTAQDVRRKLLITVLILAIYRLVSHVPVPGANPERSRPSWHGVVQKAASLASWTCCLVAQCQTSRSWQWAFTHTLRPKLSCSFWSRSSRRFRSVWKKIHGKAGSSWRSGPTCWRCPWRLCRPFGQINIFNSWPTRHSFHPSSQTLVLLSGLCCQPLTIILSMTAGTMFAIWLGELISEYGIRNQGLSLIIFSGIVSGSRLPSSTCGADEEYATSRSSSCW
jgi:preprotein translocase subunit SecY